MVLLLGTGISNLSLPSGSTEAEDHHSNSTELGTTSQPGPVILGCHHPTTKTPHGATTALLDVIAGSRYQSLRADIGLGPIKKRYSRAARGSYLSQGCVHCDALFGSFHLDEQLTEAHASGELDTLEWPTPIAIPAAVFTIDDDALDNDEFDDDALDDAVGVVR